MMTHKLIIQDEFDTTLVGGLYTSELGLYDYVRIYDDKIKYVKNKKIFIVPCVEKTENKIVQGDEYF